jgi:hypothetical protein
MLHAVDHPVIAVANCGGPHPGIGAVVANDIVRSGVGFRIADSEVKVMVLEKRGQIPGALLVIRQVLEEMRNLPSLIERHGNAQIAPGKFLADQM